jgi:hypothetical protein
MIEPLLSQWLPTQPKTLPHPPETIPTTSSEPEGVSCKAMTDEDRERPCAYADEHYEASERKIVGSWTSDIHIEPLADCVTDEFGLSGR